MQAFVFPRYRTRVSIVEEAIARHATGARIAELRRARGFSQRYFAALTGLSPGHVGNIERGHSRASDEVRKTIADALGVTVAELERAS